jgi:hypothetical protein
LGTTSSPAIDFLDGQSRHPIRFCDPRGPGRIEEPLEDGGPVRDPRAGLDVAARAALPAPQLARQSSGVGEPDMAAGAGNFDQHDCTQKNSPGRHRG